MRFTLLGAGKMGGACAEYLLSWDETTNLRIVERDEILLSKLESVVSDKRVEVLNITIIDKSEIIDIVNGSDAVICALPYYLNLTITEACIDAGVSMCDMGGNNDVVMSQLAMDDRAREAGVIIVPDCGLAPGLSNVLVAKAISEFDRCDEVHIRVGGLPIDPVPPFNYQIVFSVNGLVNEYVEPCKVLRGGDVCWVEALTDIEEVRFGGDYGVLEAFNTSGGSSTLPDTYQGCVREIDYKTLRYRGHCKLMQGLKYLGLGEDRVIGLSGLNSSPRRVLSALLEHYLPKDGDDVVLIYWWARGESGGESCEFRYKFIIEPDEDMGLSAMMVGTSLPTVLVARFIAEGKVVDKGVLTPERALPVDDYISAFLSESCVEIEEVQ